MSHPQDDTTTGLPSGASSAGGGDPLELQALADCVYRLLVAEVRLERARGTHAPTRR